MHGRVRTTWSQWQCGWGEKELLRMSELEKEPLGVSKLGCADGCGRCVGARESVEIGEEKEPLGMSELGCADRAAGMSELGCADGCGRRGHKEVDERAWMRGRRGCKGVDAMGLKKDAWRAADGVGAREWVEME
eukprot:s2702_g1.t1